MTNNYNFDEINTADRPEIVVGGETYKLRYPTIEDIERIQALKTNEEQNKAFYNFLEPTKEGQPPFETTLKKQDIRILKAFVEMIKKEFGVE